MHFSSFIGNKLARSKDKSFTRRILNLAKFSIALSIGIMIIAMAVVQGFKNEIQQKVMGFDGHVQVVNLDLNESKELVPIPIQQNFIQELKKGENIKSIAPFASKPGILNTKTDIEGLLFKGVNREFHWDFLEKSLKKGRLPLLNDSTTTYEVLISQRLANTLQLDTGDRIGAFFIHNEKVRERRFDVVGVFSTGLTEFDETVCFTDIRVIQRIIGRDYSQVSGFEILLNDLKKLETSSEWIDEQIGLKYRAISVKEKHSVIFQWLDIVDTNAYVILILMALVAIVNMVTVFLILVIERTNMVGVLKALGGSNSGIMRIFIIKATSVLLPGMILGNLFGFGVALVQKSFGLIRLDEATYYMEQVPIYLDWMSVLGINLGTFICVTLVLFLPALIVRTITPVKALRFN
jgi:lipoprotein-releasing system permease protein